MGRRPGFQHRCRSRCCHWPHTRFRLDWRWDGSETVLASRCVDETGDAQPTREALIAARGTQSSYHNNAIQAWRVRTDGVVENVDV